MRVDIKGEIMDIEIWKTNKFDDNILTEQVALFSDLNLAKDFVHYQATVGESFAIKQNGKRIDTD